MAYRENMGKSAEHNTTANLKIVTSMLIFGTIGLVRRNIPYSSTMIAFFRGAIAAIILLVLKLIRRQSLDEHSFDETEKAAIKISFHCKRLIAFQTVFTIIPNNTGNIFAFFHTVFVRSGFKTVENAAFLIIIAGTP